MLDLNFSAFHGFAQIAFKDNGEAASSDVPTPIPVKPRYTPLTLDALAILLDKRYDYRCAGPNAYYGPLNAIRDALRYVRDVEALGQSREETAELREYLVEMAADFLIRHHERKGNVCSAEDGRLTAESWLAWNEDWIGKPEDNRPLLGDAPGLRFPVKAAKPAPVETKLALIPTPPPPPVRQAAPPKVQAASPAQLSKGSSKGTKPPSSPICTAQDVGRAVGFLGKNPEEWKSVARRIATLKAEREFARKLFDELHFGDQRFEAFMLEVTGSSKEERLAKYPSPPVVTQASKKPAVPPKSNPPSTTSPVAPEEPATPPLRVASPEIVPNEVVVTFELLSQDPSTLTPQELAAVEAFEVTSAPPIDKELGMPVHHLYTGRVPESVPCQSP